MSARDRLVCRIETRRVRVEWKKQQKVLDQQEALRLSIWVDHEGETREMER